MSVMAAPGAEGPGLGLEGVEGLWMNRQRVP